jgi:plastocyanin
VFLGIVGAISFSSAFAETQVIIPLGASLQTNPFSLSPAVVNAKINDTVTWQNQDSTIHTVTTGTTQYGFDGRFDSGPIQKGDTFSHTFDKAGDYQYFCLFHPWMTGVVNVSDGSAVEPIIGITFSTNKSSYQIGDSILVSGHVSQFIPNEEITIWVEDTQGKAVSANHIETDDGSKFETSIPVVDKLWIPGNYTVFAQYGYRSAVTESQITIGSTQEQTSHAGAAQSEQTGTESAATSYSATHKIITADQNDYISVQTEKHIYFPGEQVKIFGSIWSGMFQQVGGPAYLVTASIGGPDSNSISEVVSVQARDAQGNLILNQPAVVDNNGEYLTTFKIPENGAAGQYLADAKIQTKAGLLNTIDASVSAKLGSSIIFDVSSPSQFVVKTNSGDLNVKIGSNSTINNFQFISEQKAISFTVQGQTGTKGVTLITIPKAVLGGQLSVFIDGNLQAYNSDSVIVTSDTSDSTTLEINYHHSTHTIQIVGTQAAQSSLVQAVPEFSSMTPLVLVVATISVLVLSMKTRTNLKI